MANTYTQIHLQLVFAVQNRASLIQKEWKPELYKYIGGIFQNHQHKLLIINGVADHIHILIGMRPHQALSNLMQHIKRDSSAWINDRKFLKERFSWQEGYGAFSYSKGQLENVTNYIKNQELHNEKVTFKNEYLAMLKKYEMEYDERYIFHDIE